MKKLIFAAIFTLVASQAFALSAVGFKNYSVSGGAHVPTTCAMVTGSADLAGNIITPSAVSIITLATKNSTGSFSVGMADYKFTCRKTNDGAESTVKMYFDSNTSAFFPCSSFLMRNR
jgi:hypothetical protein